MTVKDFIKQNEGLRLCAYQDRGGVWTIGYGHTGNVKKGDTISSAEAETLFEQDYQTALNGMKPYLHTPLTDNQQGVLVDFVYNLGIGNLRASTLLNVINRNPNDPQIATELMKWDKIKIKTLQGGYKYVEDAGLKNRCQARVNFYFEK